MLRSPKSVPLLRWLLRLDVPVPPRTAAEVTAEQEQNYRWNFAVNLGDVASFWFGLSFISSTTIIPLFISKLTDNTFAIGLAAVISQGAWFLPQIFTANFVESLPRKKPMVANLGFFLERLPLWLLVVAALIAVWNPAVALIVFMVGYAWHGFGAGLVATSWQDLIARCFPVERRGRFMGVSFFIGALTGAVAAGFSAQLLATFPFPTNFAYCFAIAAAAITVSWVFLSLTREPNEPVKATQQSTRQYWQELPRIIRRDKNYRNFLIARLTLSFGRMGIGFLTVAAVQRWAIADSTVAAFTIVLLVGQTTGNLFVGFLADRHGHKLSLELAALLSFFAYLLAWLAPDDRWYFGVFFLLGVIEAAIIVSGILIVMEFCEPEKRPTYAGLTNTGVGIASMLGPLLGAWLALLGYNWLFIASAALSLIALIGFHWWVREPRFAPKEPLPQELSS